MNMCSFRLLVLSFCLSLLVACGGSGNSDSKHPQISAIEKIKLYARDSSNPAPTIQDYKDVGVSGLDNIDIETLNEKVASLTAEDVDTVEELDAITAELGINISPFANAGSDQTVLEGAVVSLDGNASSDSDGTITEWLWQENETTLSASKSFSKSDFTVGIHNIVLTVTDNDGATSNDTVVVTVTDNDKTSDQGPIAKAGADQTVVSGSNVTLDASASTDNSGTITAWLWQENKTTLSASKSFSKSDFSVGTHIIVLTVTDNTGASSSDTVVVTVTDNDKTSNQAPIAKAGADQTAVSGTNITLDASASTDSDGTITKWLWQENETTLSSSESFFKSDFSVGTHIIKLTITDNDGEISSDTVAVLITDEDASTLFSIAPISDVTASEYIFFNDSGYLPAKNDEQGHYTSVTPILTGDSPIGRVAYTLSGADAEEFIINKKTGVVVLDYKDFEHPTDANKDNVYEITITATDDAGNADSENWKVTVTDVAGEVENRHIISMNGASLLRIKAGQTFVDPGVTLIPFDAGGNVTLTSMIVSNYNLDPQLASIDTNNPSDRVYHIIYSANDTADYGLSAPQVSRTIIVEDSDYFTSLGEIVTADVTGKDSSKKSFTSLEEDYVQKALYYAKTHGGGVVSLSSGVHYFKRQLIIYSDTTLEGTATGGVINTTLKLMDFAIRKAWKNNSLSFGNSFPLIMNASAYSGNFQFIADRTEESSQNISIKNLVIDGNRERQRSWKSAGSNNSIGIDIHNTAGLHIDNILLLNTLSDGIATINTSNMDVRNSTFRYMGHSALFITESTNITTDNLTIDVLSNSGIRFFGGTNFTITNNHIFCTTNGGNYAIQISNNYSSGKPVENVLIENNIIRHTAYAGIAIYSSTINDVIQGVTIKNNIIYGASSVVSNMPHFVAKEVDGRIHEGGGIVIQHAKQVDINHNTIFNNQGSGIRLDNRFYIPDGTAKDWTDLANLDRMTDKTASITNNVIVGNEVSGYSEYSDALAFGIEKRVALYCGAGQNEECVGTTVTSANNIFALNHSGKASNNITLSASDNTAFPGFVDAPLFAHDIREISYYYDEETKPDFNLVGVPDPQIGASKSILQKNLDVYDKYRSFFTPLPD